MKAQGLEPWTYGLKGSRRFCTQSVAGTWIPSPENVGNVRRKMISWQRVGGAGTILCESGKGFAMVLKRWAGVVLFFAWAVLIVACGGGVDTDLPDAPDPPQPGDKTQIDSSPNKSLPATTQDQPKPEKKLGWVKVGEWSGSGPKQTPRFQSENGEMSVNWAAGSNNDFGGGILQVFVKGSGAFNVHLAANQQIASGKASDSTNVHADRGTYYLDISAANINWVVEVYDWREVQNVQEKEKAKTQPKKESNSKPKTAQKSVPQIERQPIAPTRKPGNQPAFSPLRESDLEPEQKQQPMPSASKSDPKTLERKAAAKMRLAEKFYEDGKFSTAKSWYQEVVRDYPDTKAAKDAQKKLDAMN